MSEQRLVSDWPSIISTGEGRQGRRQRRSQLQDLQGEEKGVRRKSPEGGAAHVGHDAQHEGRVLLRGRFDHQSPVQLGRSLGRRLQHIDQGTEVGGYSDRLGNQLDHSIFLLAFLQPSDDDKGTGSTVDCRLFIFKVIEDGASSDSKFQLVGRTPLVLSASFVSNENLECSQV